MGYELTPQSANICLLVHSNDIGRAFNAIIDGWTSEGLEDMLTGPVAAARDVHALNDEGAAVAERHNTTAAGAPPEGTAPPDPSGRRGREEQLGWIVHVRLDRQITNQSGKKVTSVWRNIAEVLPLSPEEEAEWARPCGTPYWFKPALRFDNAVSWVEPKGLPKQGFGPDEQIPLFVHSAVDDYTYKLNPASCYVRDNEMIFELLGMVLAKAIVDRVTLSARFNLAFYKSLLGLPFEMKDLVRQEPLCLVPQL